MTEEEAKALGPGDVVLIPVRINARKEPDGNGTWFRGWTAATDKSYSEELRFYADAIHSVLPRPLEVGDRLKPAHGDRTSSVGIIWLDERGALVEWEDRSRGYRDLHNLSDPEKWERTQ